MAFYPGMTRVKVSMLLVDQMKYTRNSRSSWSPILGVLDDTRISVVDTLEGQNAIQREH